MRASRRLATLGNKDIIFDNMITRHEELSINKWLKIVQIDSDAEATREEKSLAITAVLCGKDVDELLNLPYTEVAELTTKAGFILEKPKLPKVRKEYRVGGYTLVPTRKAHELTTAQFIHFEEYAKKYRADGLEWLPHLLSTHLVPKGKTYNTDYDVTEVIEAIGDDMCYLDAQALLAFFLKQQKRSLRNSLISLVAAIFMIRPKSKRQRVAKWTRIKELWRVIRSLKGGVGRRV